MVKKILLFVVGLIVLLLLIGFVLPRKFELTKSEVINAPAEYVFEEINNLERWPDWSYWNTLDPNMEVKYSEQKAGTGASYEWKGNSYIGISTTMSFEDGDAISAQMGKSYGELMGVLQKAKVEIAGAPFCLYPRWDEEKKEMDMVCALPVPADAKLPAKYPVMQTSGGLAVKAIHLGDYHNLNDTHNQINQYIQYKKLEIVGAPREVFLTDPEMEKDTTKWVTEVFYPVKG